MNRMLKHLPFTVRTKEDHFEHLHSGSTRKNYKGYYTHKNLYDGELPVTPLTSKLLDSDLEQRLYRWATPKMKYPIALKNEGIYLTHNKQASTNLYDIRFKNEKGEDYFAVVESLIWEY